MTNEEKNTLLWEALHNMTEESKKKLGSSMGLMIRKRMWEAREKRFTEWGHGVNEIPEQVLEDENRRADSPTTETSTVPTPTEGVETEL
jgi:hypothetical protein